MIYPPPPHALSPLVITCSSVFLFANYLWTQASPLLTDYYQQNGILRY
jgi:hypothetical protein